MKRTLEKLAKKRQEKESNFATQLQAIQEKIKILDGIQRSLISIPDLAELEKAFPATEGVSPEEKIVSALKEIRDILGQNLQQTRYLFSFLTEFARLNVDLMDARDREWDALGSNHVGMIFKSMEWRIDRLAAGYEDAALLMKKFILLKEQLNRLLEQLEKKKLPSRVQVEDITQPLDDFWYASFENRYRGTEEDVRKQQEIYLPYFNQGRKVLDLGCGRGEFIGLLTQNGIQAEGIDINEQMIDICRDKGYDCRKH